MISLPLFDRIEMNQILSEVLSHPSCLLVNLLGENGSGKTTILRAIFYHESILTRYSEKRLLINIGKIETSMELLTLIDYLGCQVAGLLNFEENGNGYRPESIDEWILYLRDFCHINQWLILLNDVYDQIVVDIILSTGATVILTSDTPFTNKVSSTHSTFILQDLSSEEVTKYIDLYRQQHFHFPLTPTFFRLVSDVSGSPLDLNLLFSLISSFCESIHFTPDRLSEFDDYLLKLYHKRTDIATLSHELMIEKMNHFMIENEEQSHSFPSIKSTKSSKSQQNLLTLLTNIMPPVSSAFSTLSPPSSFSSVSHLHKEYIFSEKRLRKTSIFINIQIAISTLPDHIQAKYILLMILPKHHPVTVSLLSYLWQTSSTNATEIISLLQSLQLIEVSSFQPFLPDQKAQSTPENLLVSLHSMHFEYLDSLIHNSPIWLNRIQLAIDKVIQYLSHPSCIFIDELLTPNEQEILTEIPLDPYFFPNIGSLSQNFIRLGLYWRRLAELHRLCAVDPIPSSPVSSSTSFSPPPRLVPFEILHSVISNINLSLCDLSALVRYLMSSILAVEELGQEYETEVVSSWYCLLLSLMEQDTQSTHNQIALISEYYSQFLLRTGHLLEAKKYLLKAYSIYQSIYPDDHRCISSLLSRLSSICHQLGLFDEAINYLRDSLEIKSRLYGTKHQLLGRDMNNLAVILSSQKEYSEAVLYHVASIQSFQQSLGEYHLETINSRGNLGLTMVCQGEIVKGMSIIQEVLYQFFRLGIDMNHPWIHKYIQSLRQLNEVKNDGATPLNFFDISRFPSSSHPSNYHPFSSIDYLQVLHFLPMTEQQQTTVHSLHSSPLTVADMESFHKFISSCSSHSNNTPFHPDMLQNDQIISIPSTYMKKRTAYGESPNQSLPYQLTDENRSPDAALVLTE